MSNRRIAQTGFSLVETLAVIGIASVLMGSAVPLLDTMKQRHQLAGSAAQLETDLHLARTTAVAANQVLRMEFLTEDGQGCYVLHDGPARACTCGSDGVPLCTAGASAVRSVHFDAGQAVRLQANVAAIAFDPVKGTVAPTATLRLAAPVGQLQVVVNVMGRVRSCSPDAAVPGQPAC